jgi:ubiquinone biosynthesis protein COQ9
MNDFDPTLPSFILRERLLDAMLPEAARDGWTLKALRKAADDIRLSVGEVELAAPNGVIDLIDAVADRADREMARNLTEHDLAALKIRARVTLAIRTRLETLEPHKEAIRRSILAMSVPVRAGVAARIGWRTADRIWNGLGDTSTDANWYSKRAILAAVHAAVLFHWSNDKSEDQQSTWDFLDRRIENVMQFEKLKAQAKPFDTLPGAALSFLARMRYGTGGTERG